MKNAEKLKLVVHDLKKKRTDEANEIENAEALKSILEEFKNTAEGVSLKILERLEAGIITRNEEFIKQLLADSVKDNQARDEKLKAFEVLLNAAKASIEGKQHEGREVVLRNIAQMQNDIVAIKERPHIEIPKSFEIKEPAWWHPFSDSKILNAIGTVSKHLSEAIIKAVMKVDMSLHEDPRRALAVKLVDKDGHFYKAKAGSGGSGIAATTLIEGYQSLVPFTGTVVTAGTPVQLFSSATPCKKVKIQAGTGTGFIVIGNSNVNAATNNGLKLASMQADTFEVSDASMLWIDSTVSAKGFNGYYVN